RLRRIATMDSTGIFTKQNIMHVVELVFNRPVTTPNQLDLFKRDEAAASDGITHVSCHLARVDVSSLVSAAQDLGDTRPSQIVIRGGGTLQNRLLQTTMRFVIGGVRLVLPEGSFVAIDGRQRGNS